MPIRNAYKPGEFNWVDLMARDMDRARDFYGNVFGWSCSEHIADGRRYAAFHQEGRAVAGLGQMGPEALAAGQPATWNSYVSVESCEEIERQVPGLGGRVLVPATRVLEAGWLSYIADPAGAVIATWQPTGNIGAELVSEPGAFCWNELATPDFEEARLFYTALFGWEYERNLNAPGVYHLIKNRGTDNGGILTMDEQWAGIPPHWMVYFAVEDTDLAVVRVKSHGGTVKQEPFDTGYGRMAIVADPDGAIFTLIRLAPPPVKKGQYQA